MYTSKNYVEDSDQYAAGTKYYGRVSNPLSNGPSSWIISLIFLIGYQITTSQKSRNFWNLFTLSHVLWMLYDWYADFEETSIYSCKKIVINNIINIFVVTI